MAKTTINASAGLDIHLHQQVPMELDVALSCAPGELLALVGPSGAGKTSVLRAIAGLLSPTSGNVSCNGETWFSSDEGLNLRPQQRSVGFVFQDYALFPHLSAHDNVAIAMDNNVPVCERRQRTKNLLAIVNLEGLEVRRPAELSGGQRQRVALARALARDPDVLLLDEPFSAVDQITRERLKRELVELHGKLNIPIVLVTHDLEEAIVLADRIAVLYRGKLLECGQPDDMRLRPGSRLVARLMGQTNVFQGEVLEPSDKGRYGRLRFGDIVLSVASTGRWKAGDEVTWMVASEHVVLHRRGKAKHDENETQLSGKVIEFTRLGEQTAIAVALAELDKPILNLKLPHRSIDRNGVELNADVTVSLRADGIHLMAPDT
ncbi:MAG: ABC transporter ATP-binding protein [Hyphomicrobiaceae bacterium]